MRRASKIITAVLAALAAATAMAVRAEAADQPHSLRPAIRHVFVVNLENKGYDETFGPSSPAPYLSRTLRGQGQLLTQYYGVAHNSLPNYVAQISGQGPNLGTQADCPWYTDFWKVGDSDRQAIGQGCVYPASVPTVADQLTAKGLTLGLPAGHGYAVPAPGGWPARRHAEGSPGRPVRGPAQSVPVLPLDHR